MVGGENSLLLGFDFFSARSGTLEVWDNNRFLGMLELSTPSVGFSLDLLDSAAFRALSLKIGASLLAKLKDVVAQAYGVGSVAIWA